ncbi:hypothetical protein GLA29479_3673 [Lysobacter antibioticus]|nr:DUF4279 domain-containing protein [Lysobacter antibioticus]ALN64524.1 hypothetical protein GLA29479_3673 [Lysobacter antibioticus]
MGALDHSFATLRLFGDDLVPEQISALLGAEATAAERKGETLVGRVTGGVRIAKTGSWRLRATEREPEDLEAQVFEILDQLSADPSVWRSLARYEPDLFCGIFMRSSNDGLCLSPKALLALCQRGIELSLDIYDPCEEDAEARP